MEPKLFCQSCTMPIDNAADRGTEKDGSNSTEYCKYCYQNGAFINPGMSLENMKALITEKMQEMHLPISITQKSMDMLAGLKRWRTQKI